MPLASSAKVVTFGGFNRCIARFAWPAWLFVMFSNIHNVSKVVLCDRRISFASFSEDELHLQAQNVDLHRHFAWQAQQAQHLRRVVWHILRIAVSGLRQVLTTCKLCGRRGIL